MKTKSLFLALMLLSYASMAQMKVVALHKATGVQIFTGVDPFIAAYNASAAGDTIYLSGGAFAAPANFDRQLFIYGVGHHPDSTAATNPTVITGHVILTENADNFYIEGVNLKNNFSTVENASVTGITVKRTKIDGNVDFHGAAVNSTHNTFIECVFLGHFNAQNTTNSGVFNSIFQWIVHNSNANVFRNNIFLPNVLSWHGNVFHYSHNNNISNNVIINYHGTIAHGNGNNFNNNLFVHASPGYGTNPILIGNYTGIAHADIFVNQTGNAFSYEHDYNLKTPAAWLGNDNPRTQVGIYGGAFPFKTASVPITPHISSKNISSSTDSNGMLQINIRVIAQQN